MSSPWLSNYLAQHHREQLAQYAEHLRHLLSTKYEAALAWGPEVKAQNLTGGGRGFGFQVGDRSSVDLPSSLVSADYFLHNHPQPDRIYPSLVDILASQGDSSRELEVVNPFNGSVFTLHGPFKNAPSISSPGGAQISPDIIDRYFPSSFRYRIIDIEDHPILRQWMDLLNKER